MITRRRLLISSAAAAAAASLASRAFAAAPPLAKKDTYKVGFAQTESNNPWRLAQTKSMQDEAAKRRNDSENAKHPRSRLDPWNCALEAIGHP